MTYELKHLDPRLRHSTDCPDCFYCGKAVRSWQQHIGIETDHSPRLECHSSCAGNAEPVELAARYWMAVRAAVPGLSETPNPAAARVAGRFM